MYIPALKAESCRLLNSKERTYYGRVVLVRPSAHSTRRVSSRQFAGDYRHHIWQTSIVDPTQSTFTTAIELRCNDSVKSRCEGQSNQSILSLIARRFSFPNANFLMTEELPALSSKHGNTNQSAKIYSSFP